MFFYLVSTVIAENFTCEVESENVVSNNTLLNKFYEPEIGKDYNIGVEDIRKKIVGSDGNITIQVNWVYMGDLQSSNISNTGLAMDAVTANFQKNNLPFQFKVISETRADENYPLSSDDCGPQSMLYNKYGNHSPKVLNIFSGNYNNISGTSAFSKFPKLGNNHTEGVFFIRGDPDLLTHEIGHFLGLMHTFWGTGCDDPNNDFVKDTPVVLRKQETKNGSTSWPSFNWQCDVPQHTCKNQPQQDMINNFMDYTSCGTRFTDGQRYRMMNFLYFRFNGSMPNSPSDSINNGANIKKAIHSKSSVLVPTLLCVVSFFQI